MYFNGLFKKRLSLNQGEALLSDYCKINGFDDNTTQWKVPRMLSISLRITDDQIKRYQIIGYPITVLEESINIVYGLI